MMRARSFLLSVYNQCLLRRNYRTHRRLVWNHIRESFKEPRTLDDKEILRM